MSWKGIVKTVAPVLGTALGSPIAGTAVKFLADHFLGEDQQNLSQSQLEKQLGAILENPTPDQLLQIKQLDSSFEERMAELGVDVFKLEVQDRADARANHKDSIMPAVIVIMLTLMVAVGTAALMNLAIPKENASIVYMVFGQTIGFWGASIAYWVGTTKSSNDKNRMLKGQV